MTKNIVLVGLGPHSKRIYINVFKKYNILPKLIIDLKSQEKNLKKYLEKEKIDVELFLIPDKYKDDELLDINISKELVDKLKN